MFNDLEEKHSNMQKVLYAKNEKNIEAFFDENNHLIINFSENAGLDNTFLGDINYNHYYEISKDKIKLLNLLSNNDILEDEKNLFILLEDIMKNEKIRNNFKDFLTENNIDFELNYRRS